MGWNNYIRRRHGFVLRNINSVTYSGGSDVAQVSNLLYRRASSLPVVRVFIHARVVGSLPIGNRRYSRLETYATSAYLCPRVLRLTRIRVAGRPGGSGSRAPVTRTGQ